MPELVGFKIIPKELFFEKDKIEKAFNRGRVVAMSMIGAFIMTRERTLTGRSSRRSASPGQPPKRHTSALHDKIFFAAKDSTYQDVAVGPLVFKTSGNDADVPGLLEKGGRAMRRPFGRGELREVTYRAFPFAAPSLKEAIENGKLSEPWANVVHS